MVPVPARSWLPAGLLLGLLACSGADQDPAPAPADLAPGASPAPAAPTPGPDLAALLPASSSVLDTTGFVPLHREPVTVPKAMYLACTIQIQAIGRGPHFDPNVSFHANPLAADALAEERAILPVGSVITKTKRWRADQPRPDALASMIKREPGYDPEHGDWEYVYEDLGQGGTVTRGRLESCITCHSHAAAGDYLYRRYTQEAAMGAEAVAFTEALRAAGDG